MRSYCSLYVDAGYLMAAASTRVTGTSLRGATDMDVAALLADLTAQVEADSGLPLLRIHWYDAGTRTGGPVGDQREIASLPRVKLRLGRVGFNGEQKGVDLKLALDLIAQSRNQVAEVVYLVSGDDDLSEAVEEAQQLGVQVVGLAVPAEDGQPIAVARHLQMTVDRMALIDGQVIEARVKRAAAAAMAVVAAAVRTAPEPAPPAAVPDHAPDGNRPTPLLITRQRLAVSPPAPDRVRPAPTYVTTTGIGGHYLQPVPGDPAMTADTAEAIDFVVGKVIDNWWRGATEAGRAELMEGRPVIPAEIDRTLLNDLSNRLDVFELPQEWRFALRDAFWEKLARL